MTRTLLSALALASLLLVALSAPFALALDEAERLWLVGEQASADGLHPLARRVLERFIAEYPNDPRLPSAVLLVGRARLALGDADLALEAFRRFRTLAPPARRLEGRFWEAEALYRVKRFAEARAAYDDVMRQDAASPLAPDAAYGLALSDLELRRPEAAAKALRDLVTTWPEHPQAPSASFYLAQTLFELKRYADALPLLTGFATKYPKHRLVPDAQYLLGSTRLAMGDREVGVNDLKAFVAAYPSHQLAPAARQTITATLAKHGNRTQQQGAYAQLMQQSPPTPEAFYDAGLIAGRIGQRRSRPGSASRPRAARSARDATPARARPARRARRAAGPGAGGDRATAGSAAAGSDCARALRRGTDRETADRRRGLAAAAFTLGAPDDAAGAHRGADGRQADCPPRSAGHPRMRRCGARHRVEGPRVRARALRQERVLRRGPGSRSGGPPRLGSRLRGGSALLARRDLLSARPIPAGGRALPSGCQWPEDLGVRSLEPAFERLDRASAQPDGARARHLHPVPDGDAVRAGGLGAARSRARQLRARSARRGGGGMDSTRVSRRSGPARARRFVLARRGARARRPVRAIGSRAHPVRPGGAAPAAGGGLGAARLVEPGGRALS